MKKSIFKIGQFFLLAAGLLAVMSACKKDSGTSELRAVMNDFASSNQKAYIDNEKYSCFVTGETVRVNNNTGIVTALSGRLNRECSISNVDEANDNHYLAFYPANLLKNQNEDLRSGLDDVVVSFPREQEYRLDNTNGRQIIDNPMMAELTGFGPNNNTLHFRNLCALLKLNVCTSDAFDSIRVTIPDTKLWGDGHISTSDDKVIMDDMSGTSLSYRSSVVLKLPAGHYGSPIGEDFYIMIPEVTVANCTVTVEILNRSTTVKSFSLIRTTSATLEHNKIHRLAVFSFNASMFSVAANRKVVFSPGNLQWSYTGGGSTPTTHGIKGTGYDKGTWRFAEIQYNFIGKKNENALGDASGEYTQTSYTEWIDLFAWGGSGYMDSRPFACSPPHEYYYNNSNLGDYDWGAFNDIYNPKTGNVDPYGTWRTLSPGEWSYLFFNRGIDENWWRFSNIAVGLAPGDSVFGLIIYPDGITSRPLYHNNKSDFSHDNTSYEGISKLEFDTLDNLGCAFLPAAGHMARWYSVEYYPKNGYYWSNSSNLVSDVYYGVPLYFVEEGSVPSVSGGATYNVERQFLSVRLARDVK
ncbi:MAG: hypothetical protein J6X35_08175 [Bacteroidales bacterium]|nr:hypothetical protein [Bacteroidales bacterium]